MLTPIMMRAMRWTPLWLTLVWKTMPVMAEAARFRLIDAEKTNDQRTPSGT